MVASKDESALFYCLSLSLYCGSLTVYSPLDAALFLGLYLGSITAVLLWPSIGSALSRARAKLLGASSLTQPSRILVKTLSLTAMLAYLTMHVKSMEDSSSLFLGKETASPLIIFFLFGVFLLHIYCEPRSSRKATKPKLLALLSLFALLQILAFLALAFFSYREGFSLFQASGKFAADVMSSGFLDCSIGVILSLSAFFLLPHQFYLLFTEADGKSDSSLSTARSVLLLYLPLSFFIALPLASKGSLLSLSLLLQRGYYWTSALLYLGSLSASLGILLLSCKALTETMMSSTSSSASKSPGRNRTLAALLLIILFLFNEALADFPRALYSALLAMSGIAQLLPAALLLLLGRRLRWSPYFASIGTGFLCWLYTLLLPLLADTLGSDPLGGALGSVPLGGATGQIWEILKRGTIISLGSNAFVLTILALLQWDDEKEKEKEKAIEESETKISEEKHRMLQRHIEQLQEEILQRKEAQKEARLRQEQLVKAHKLVALGTLVSGVAHEINNPNNYISLNASLIDDIWKELRPVLDKIDEGEEDPLVIAGMDYAELCREMPLLCAGISEGSAKIAKIVKNLRNYVRPRESDKSKLVCDPQQAIKDGIDLLAARLRRHTREFQTKVEEELPKIRGISNRDLQEVIINLLQNAYESGGERKAQVTFSARYEREESRIVILVSDDGEGIAEQDLPRVLDPFFSTKRDKGHTGLGLSLCHSIVQSIDGSITIESKEGEGCSVTLKIPPIQEIQF